MGLETHLQLGFGNPSALIHVQRCEGVPYGFQQLLSKPHVVGVQQQEVWLSVTLFRLTSSLSALSVRLSETGDMLGAQH